MVTCLCARIEEKQEKKREEEIDVGSAGTYSSSVKTFGPAVYSTHIHTASLP